jgi:hypothetical protein
MVIAAMLVDTGGIADQALGWAGVCALMLAPALMAFAWHVLEPHA